MIEEILTKLNEITAANRVQILYACESGSRAWGFPSADSDYDVRFIYLHTPDTYLSIDEPRDTIDLPVNEVLDINGWDLKKALRLFRGSNAALYEWILSPVVYAQSGAFRTRIHTIMNDYFSPKDGMHHYMGVARNSFSALMGEEVKLKKYFYCLRSVLAAMWIAEKQEVPPMEFRILRTMVTDDRWHREVDALLALKATANESTLVPPVALLHQFITLNLAECEEKARAMTRKETDKAPLNQLFRDLLHEI